MTGVRVLVVDDDDEMRDAICDVLTRYGFEPAPAATCAEALEQGAAVELVILDLGLPDGDGLSVCAALAPTTPIIVVSARGSETDRVAALEVGADDYLSKPFSPRELVARCRSVLRRSTATSRTVRAGDLQVDIERYDVRIGGQPVELTTKERELLVAIARRNGALVRRAELADEVWGSALWPVTRSIDVHVSSLRRKLGDTARPSRYIETVHGLGFRLVR